MTRIIIHGDEEITFSSKAYGFYAYKNRRTREEILLYRLYQRDKKKGEECWILLSRDKERIETIKYILSSDFTSNFFQSAVIKGVFDDDSFHLLNFLMLLNGYNRMTLLDENKNPMVSLIAPTFDSHIKKKSKEVMLVDLDCNVEADWGIKRSMHFTLDEIWKEGLFPSHLISSCIPSVFALSIIKFGLFSEQSTSWFTYALSPLDTFSSLPLAIHYSLPDQSIKVIINNGGSMTMDRENDIYFCDDIFSILEKEEVERENICKEVKRIFDKALRLGLSMTNDEWRELLESIAFRSEDYPREGYIDLFRFILSTLPGEVISPTNGEMGLLDITSSYMEESLFHLLQEEMEERVEYVEALRES